jgi:P-type Cu2+ transporter
MNDEHRHGPDDTHSTTDEAPAKPGYPKHPEKEAASRAAEHGHGDHHEHGTGRGHDHGGHGEHDKHAGHSVEMFRSRFWLSLALTIPVVFWAEHVEMILGYQAPVFPGSAWIGPVLGTVVFLYGGLVFLKGAWGELRARLPGMMTLISLAITVAFVFSWVVQLGLIEAEAIWWELATLVTIMLLGHWIEMRSISQAQGALQELAKLLPDTATRISDGGRRRSR